MKIAQYTRQEARLLEDLYIQGYKKEGLWGKGRPPESGPRPDHALTPSQMLTRVRYKAAKEEAYRLLCEGHDTAGKISKVMGITTSSVRRYLRDLQDDGLAEMIDGKEGFQFTWRPK